MSQVHNLTSTRPTHHTGFLVQWDWQGSTMGTYHRTLAGALKSHAAQPQSTVYRILSDDHTERVRV